jgi:predicted RNA-binding Zn ribbon-like protein
MTIKTHYEGHSMTSQPYLLVIPDTMSSVADLPAWVPDGETKPAPMPLLMVQAFVNTWEADAGTDLLGDDEEAARAWLREAGLLAPGAETIDLSEVRALRESIRALLVRNGGGPPPTAAEMTPLRALGERSRLVPLVGADGDVELQPEGDRGAPAALARVLLIIRDAQREGTWERLKACRNDECRWAFFDRSHAGRGAWCDMAVCGNRIKNRNLRTRRAGANRD